MGIGRHLCWLGLAALLPAAAYADGSEVHTFHCLHSCPTGAPATNDLVVREIYTLSSNDATKFADWVAYRITPRTIGPSGARAWAADPWLAPSETLEPPDYTGAPNTLIIDRGHQAPLASFSGTEHPEHTNLLSNITPQGRALNQGPWVRLEDAERSLVRSSNAPLYVLTGPLYERNMTALPRADEPHRVPSGYWKIVMTEDGRLSAFLMDTGLARNAPHCGQRTTVETIEQRSNLRFFPDLARRNFRSLDAALGCP
jgi:endonuclease G, mitochondrial